ncbi:MAG: TIGR03435 family protein [Acidobacteriaceae bacterium]
MPRPVHLQGMVRCARSGARLPFGILAVVIFAALEWLAPQGASAQLVQLQSGESMPSFEVAAIRPNHSGSGREQIWHNDNSWRVENLSLRELIRDAWGAASNSQVVGGDGALLAEHFDINAKISDADTAHLAKLSRADSNRQVDLMLQGLLTDRFGLKVQIETKDLPVFALRIAKSGVKFHASVPVPSDKPGAPPELHTTFNVHWGRTGAEISVTNHTLQSSLIRILGWQPETEGRPLLDETGLTGTYDFDLRWTPEILTATVKPGDNSTIDPGPAGPSLLTALEDQLGLKLDSERSPVEVLVIDRVAPPSAN